MTSNPKTIRPGRARCYFFRARGRLAETLLPLPARTHLREGPDLLHFLQNLCHKPSFLILPALVPGILSIAFGFGGDRGVIGELP